MKILRCLNSSKELLKKLFIILCLGQTLLLYSTAQNTVALSAKKLVNHYCGQSPLSCKSGKSQARSLNEIVQAL